MLIIHELESAQLAVQSFPTLNEVSWVLSDPSDTTDPANPATTGISDPSDTTDPANPATIICLHCSNF